ncbi:hypothetical protein J437_LFUL003356, partial [Ladona fulva]
MAALENLLVHRLRIKQTRKDLDQNARQLLKLHLTLSATASPCDWERIDLSTVAQEEILVKKETDRQKNKFERLSGPRRENQGMDPKKLVINLTEKPLDEATTSILSKGLNFAPSPSTIPYRDYIGGIEQAVRYLPKETADEIREQVGQALKKAKPPRSNIKRAERTAITNLRNNPDILALPADKGNATVIIRSEDYHKKILDILTDPSYAELKKDPTDSILRKTSALIRKSSIPTELHKTLLPQAPVPPRLYGLPKIHKQDIPLRPIISGIDSPTYHLARYLSKLLAPHIGKSPHHVKNSKDFIEKIRQYRLSPNDLLVSFDVISLFTRVPVDDTIQLLTPWFDHSTLNLFHLTLKSTYFLYKG